MRDGNRAVDLAQAGCVGHAAPATRRDCRRGRVTVHIDDSPFQILMNQNLYCSLSKVKLHSSQMPSSTVENYLKAIYIGTSGLEPSQRLLPMGQLASALNVTPGTATTMVKTLADSGLGEYAPEPTSE